MARRILAVDDERNIRRLVKADAATAELPVIMISGKAQGAELFRGGQSGVDCPLTKPFDPLDLLGHVRRVLDNRPARAAAGLETGIV